MRQAGTSFHFLLATSAHDTLIIITGCSLEGLIDTSIVLLIQDLHIRLRRMGYTYMPMNMQCPLGPSVRPNISSGERGGTLRVHTRNSIG